MNIETFNTPQIIWLFGERFKSYKEWGLSVKDTIPVSRLIDGKTVANFKRETSEEWRVKSEEWRVKNEEWRMKSEEWRMKSEEWRMKSEEWGIDALCVLTRA